MDDLRNKYIRDMYMYEVTETELIVGKKHQLPGVFQYGKPYEYVEEVVRIPRAVFQECFLKWVRGEEL